MKYVVLIAGLLFTLNAGAQAFPSMQGELLNESTIDLPEDCKGKYTLIGLAYSQKAEAELRSWYDPSIDKFILKRGMFDDDYDLNLYFIPMFGGVTKVSYQKSMKKVKELTDPELHDNVVFFKGDVKEYKQILELDDKEHPSFFFLSPDGKILERFSDQFKEKYFETITEIIDTKG